MAYTLSQIYEALSKTENGGAMVADLQEAISKTRDEAAKNRIERNKVLDSLNLRDGGNVDESLKNLAALLAVVQQQGGDPTQLGSQMQSLQAQVKELTDKYTASEKKAKEEHDRRVQTAIRSKAMAALTNGKAINPEAMLKVIADNISMKEDETVVYRNGDTELSLEDGVAGWLKDNPWAVKNDMQTGTGSNMNTGGKKQYSLEDLKGMTREEINAHWSEISKGVDK